MPTRVSPTDHEINDAPAVICVDLVDRGQLSARSERLEADRALPRIREWLDVPAPRTPRRSRDLPAAIAVV
jgi:hypothetical protein